MALLKAYIGMQCFWGVESSFAKLPGVLKTRVGYAVAGGSTSHPTYFNIGDHIEITELEYDAEKTSYSQILNHFWAEHDPTVKHKKQYQSAILYTSDEQKQLAERSLADAQKTHKKPIQTLIQKFDAFYQAEDYHQKYWLRGQWAIFKALALTDKQLAESTLAAKVNAYMAGYDDFEVLNGLAEQHKIDGEIVKLIKSIAEAGGVPGACH